MLNKKAAKALWQRALLHIEINEPHTLLSARKVGKQTFRKIKTQEFLRQYCFVVYASGFNFKNLKKRFDLLSLAFHDFEIDEICKMQSLDSALLAFNNVRKARNFRDGVRMIAAEGFKPFKKRVKSGGPDALLALPGIGPITKNHLAKNIGLADVAKDDVWLDRAANQCGAENSFELVDFIHEKFDEKRHVVDVAIWILGRDGQLRG